MFNHVTSLLPINYSDTHAEQVCPRALPRACSARPKHAEAQLCHCPRGTMTKSPGNHNNPRCPTAPPDISKLNSN